MVSIFQYTSKSTKLSVDEDVFKHDTLETHEARLGDYIQIKIISQRFIRICNDRTMARHILIDFSDDTQKFIKMILLGLKIFDGDIFNN